MQPKLCRGVRRLPSRADSLMRLSECSGEVMNLEAVTVPIFGRLQIRGRLGSSGWFKGLRRGNQDSGLLDEFIHEARRDIKIALIFGEIAFLVRLIEQTPLLRTKASVCSRHWKTR